MFRNGTISFPAVQSAPAAALNEGDLIDGTYQVDKLLGVGGGGSVYLVRHQQLAGARFALKIMRGEHARPEALEREAQLAAQIASAHVVKITGLGRLPGGAPYLVMEHVEGPTLETLLSDRDLSRAEALSCGRQLCLALEAVHEQGLLHGDVSLRNIFATEMPDGRRHFQLADFGLARRARKGDGTLSFETTGVAGTPRFLAPELIAGDEGGDARSDVFAVGVVLYRLLCGAYPFDGANAQKIIGSVLRGTHPPPAGIRPSLGALAQVIEQCLAPDSADRFASARDVRCALEQAQAQVQAVDGQPTRAGPRLRRGWAFAAVAVLAVCSAAGLWSFRHRAAIPIGAALDCPDTAGEPAIGRALAQTFCAEVGAQLDIDWGGPPGATRISTKIEKIGGKFRFSAETLGRVLDAEGETPLAAAIQGAQDLIARAQARPLSAEEIHSWGARDAFSAAAVRAMWRRRTAMVMKDYTQEPRAVRAQDPDSPWPHFLLFQVERDPKVRAEAAAQALAHLDRLPPDRAAAMRGYLEVASHPNAPQDGLALLRLAYNSSPQDLDVGILYSSALDLAEDGETAKAVATDLHAREPRRSILAAYQVDLASLEDRLHFARWLLEAVPSSGCSTLAVEVMIESGRSGEAESACAYAEELGVSPESRFIGESLLALASGDPARIDAVTVRNLGSPNTWTQTTSVTLRTAGLLVTGRIAAALKLLHSELAASHATNASVRSLRLATGLLRIERLRGTVPAPEEIEALERNLPGELASLSLWTAASTESALARARGDSAAAARSLDQLNAELERRGHGDALALLGARLHALPLVRLARGDAAAADLWRSSTAAPRDDRLETAFEAALALDASAAPREAEEALLLAASSESISAHALESTAARALLARRYLQSGRASEARVFASFVERAWSAADPGLKEAILTPASARSLAEH